LDDVSAETKLWEEYRLNPDDLLQQLKVDL